MIVKWLIVISLIGFVAIINEVYSCNEAVCGSVVSKCLLTQSCKCDKKENCDCCKDCQACLSYLYSECCSCVEMCPTPNDTVSAISKMSYCEEVSSVPSLFNALTEGGSEKEWSTVTFPIDIDASQFDSKRELKIYRKTSEQETIAERNNNVFTMNCTVAYWAQCMSSSKCRQSCLSMGASSYRWFHDGCCECIGDKCVNYGIPESRCSDCPIKDEQVIDEEDAYYGEDDD
ncbi:unnamed protein product [Brassicogethes aeneus]|uniref:Protein twisted gastrulation n=1 Tax=Brassicogethes aeneus TaxID=1431903 RepID=A0A9P0APY3_BRAAE|nr:unnamed protein product [Brassicogethes aeneus]